MAMVKYSTLEQRYDIEREKFDQLTKQVPIEVFADGVNFSTMAPADPYTPGVAEFLGDLAGKRVLEVGCGSGRNTALLGRTGALVSAFDISPASVETARRYCEANGVAGNVDLRVAVGEDLPYSDEEFDVVFGQSILHHLDVQKAGPELFRVLRQGGMAAYSEPIAYNGLIKQARDRLPYFRKAPRGTDIPLTPEDIAAWSAGYAHSQVIESMFLGALERIVGWQWEFPTLHRLDQQLLGRYPQLRSLATYCVILLRK